MNSGLLEEYIVLLQRLAQCGIELAAGVTV